MHTQHLQEGNEPAVMPYGADGLPTPLGPQQYLQVKHRIIISTIEAASLAVRLLCALLRPILILRLART